MLQVPGTSRVCPRRRQTLMDSGSTLCTVKANRGGLERNLWQNVKTRKLRRICDQEICR